MVSEQFSYSFPRKAIVAPPVQQRPNPKWKPKFPAPPLQQRPNVN